jgi:transcriptional accessory protein Tex/SPT6
MSGNDTKHVQTELSEDEYEQFREFAREHGLSIKEAGHEALVEWIERQQQADPNDPAFTVLDELEDESLPESAATDARSEDDLVEEWDGSGESFTLADDPSAQS